MHSEQFAMPEKVVRFIVDNDYLSLYLFLESHYERIDEWDGNGETLLYTAVRVANLEIVDLLIAEGANPNIGTRISHETPLHLAVKNKSVDIVRRLLESPKINVAQPNTYSRRPIDYAVPDTVIYDMLLQKMEDDYV